MAIFFSNWVTLDYMKNNKDSETYKHFIRHYKRLLGQKLSEISVKNISSNLAHKPNFELLINKTAITLRIKPGHIWEEWVYEIQKNCLTINNSVCTQEQTKVFLDMFDYVLDESNKSHVFILEQ